MQIRAVLDTNIVLSALGWGGKPGMYLELVRSNRIEGLSCMELFQELSLKLDAKLQYSPDQVSQALIDLLGVFRLIEIPGKLQGILTDPGDHNVLECAIVGHATHIVTGDRRHLLRIKNYQGIQIVTASEFLDIVAKG